MPLRFWIKNLDQLDEKRKVSPVFVAVFINISLAGLFFGVLIWIFLSVTMFVFNAAVSG